MNEANGALNHPLEPSSADGTLPTLSGESADAPRLTGCLPPIHIEGYEILGALGAGGMGTVWRARQLSTRREVALKLLASALFASPRSRSRFIREVELAARLQHPNIARVYDSGIHQNVYFYAMELIEGVALDRHVREHELDRRQILELMGRVCQAVQYAHVRGVIHRDLKPSNILVSADGEPHVVDFGLAKMLADQAAPLEVTVDGATTGTPAFMSPEQASGRGDEVDTRSDVYSLGKILYQLLTGEPAHDLEGPRYVVLKRIAEEEVRPPRRMGRGVDAELQDLLLKALARQPEDRYGTAGQLGEDLGNYLDGEPLDARPATTGYFLRKRMAKYRWQVMVVAAVVAVLLGIAVTAYRRIAAERSRATTSEQFLQQAMTSVRSQNGRGRLVTVRELLEWTDRQAGRQLADEPEVEATIRATLGMSYYTLEAYPQAQAQLDRAVKLRQSVLGPTHRDTLSAINDWIVVRRALGQSAEVEPLCRQVVETSRQTLGTESLQTLRACLTWACLLSDRGRHAEAEALAGQVVAARQRKIGDYHADTLAAMRTRAMIVQNSGRLADAEKLFQELQEIRYGPGKSDYPKVLESMHDLGVVLAAERKFPEARMHYVKTLQLAWLALGPDYKYLPPWSKELAAILRAEGKNAEAEAVLKALPAGTPVAALPTTAPVVPVP